MRLGYHSITWGGVVGDPTGVTSIKDLYYRANGSMPQAIREIAAAGFEGIEMFDGNVADYADRPDRLEQLLADAGLKLISVYSGANFIYPDVLPDELYRVERAAELAAKLGAEHLVVGGGARRPASPLDEEYERLAAALDQVVEIADSRGLIPTYHPHLSTIVENPDQIDKIMRLSRIGFCPDTAHLAAAGGDPAQLIRRYGERIPLIHLKDLQPDPLTFQPLGRGVLDLPDIISAIREIGYDGWLVVELDAYQGQPSEAATISKACLLDLLAR